MSVYAHTDTDTHVVNCNGDKTEKSQIRQIPSRGVLSIKIWSYTFQLPQKLVLPEGRILFSLTFNLNLNPHVN